MLIDYSFDFIKVTPKNGEGVIGSFIFGFLTSVAWVSCYSAYLILLISLLVTTADPFYVAFNIILYCLGFGLTILVLSYLISKIKFESFVNRTNYIPKIFAILIIVSAVYMMI